GVYKSVDAGKTWAHVGLGDTRQIGRIVVHPKDEDTAFVAALGHVFGPNAERGIFKTTDGGETWRRVKFVTDRTGAIDVCFDPFNPRVVYAAFWQVSRTPWSLSSGGEGSGLWRSRDGGETWEELTKGLPKGIKGKIGVSASAAKRDLVYAIVEAEEGGVFRSDDGGDSWRRVNDDRNLRQRAWYYTHIYADPQEAETVYVLNVRFHKSTDGGRSFGSIRVPHVDNHDLWIAPENNQRIINSNDGGANISFDGGQTWSRQDNQPTAQFYRVITDNNFPYRVYGAQQDNSTVSISSRQRLGWREDHYDVGGGESGYIAVRHDNPDIVYAGSYGGYLTRYDHETGKTRNIMVWPDTPMGAGVEAMKHRFQWTFPIVVSPHDSDVLYVGGERVFKSTNEGQSWEAISPDLTTNDKTKQGPSGGPITKDNTGVEYYCTVFTIAESPIEQGVIWAGSDDGLVHVTSDGGATWKNVTPPDMGDWPMISLIDASPHDVDTAYVAVNRYKMDDFTPYIYVTRDRGETWELITEGIARDAFVRTVREDPVRKGLLFAGTETGMWMSLDDGKHWRPMQRNLPIVPVTDLVVKDDDVVISTQGRSFWILDDITPLRQATPQIVKAERHLFAPGDAYRQGWDRVRVHYKLDDAPDRAVSLEIVDSSGEVVHSFDAKGRGEDGGDEDEDEGWGGGRGRNAALPAKAGMNMFEWNMRMEGADR
ncbi:MAG: glycosyl hydrolase, partial [Planctomycetota bacterium]|nr:glycosyl hydrolase [Planctomycetota bacterium]